MKQITVLLALALCAATASGQDITNTLGAGGSFTVKDSANTFLSTKQTTGLTGIGTNATNPRAQLEVGGTDDLLATGTFGSGTALTPGAGPRLHWYPKKAAFRAGAAETYWWDDAYIGNYSVAMGCYPRASGKSSTAIGAYNKATGDYSLALGNYSTASGLRSIAIGTDVYATGVYSIAIGQGANTNSYDGAMVIGDDQYFQVAYATQDNQITMRFSGLYGGGGDQKVYRFWTGFPEDIYGVYMNRNSNGWSAYCDRNRKENFRELDGEEVLAKIRGMPVTEWNVKGEPSIKYIGPVAQDFYAAFRLYGNDSLGINTICIDGVNMAGVQALEKRTGRMQAENETLQVEVGSLRNQLVAQQSAMEQTAKEMRSENEVLRAQLSTQQVLLDKIQQELASLKSGAADRAGLQGQPLPLALTNTNSK